MKKLVFLSIALIWLAVSLTSNVNAQGVGVNSSGNQPDPSAIFDASSTSKGALLPRMTTAQRDAISSPALGLLILNTDCQNLNLFTTIGWQPVNSPILPGPAGTITGSPTVCQSQNNVSFSVPVITAATSYTWTYSGTGATINGATNSITIDFSASATSGNITVTGTNQCGNGTASANYAITVNTSPASPTAGTNTPSQTQIVWNWNTVSGATGYKWNTTNLYSSATDMLTATSKTETGLTCNTAYTRYVWAYNSCGNSTATSLTQTTSSCAPVTALDASSAVTGTTTSNAFTINTTNNNEIILVNVHGDGGGGAFNGSVTVTGAGAVTQVASVNGQSARMALYACVATVTGSHTVTITWGTNWSPAACLGYAASYTGFSGTPTVASNVQSVTAISSTSGTVSASITPAVANSCIYGGYYTWKNLATVGTVTWTNNTLIRTDLASGGGYDASIANRQFASTSSVTVTASDSHTTGCGPCTVLILAVVHP